MQIDASNPYISIKTALRFALGSKGIKRPIFFKRGIESITLKDEYDEYEFLFDKLNYDYINQIQTSDVTTYNDKDYGMFFYEYGRALLGNLMICLSKADWYSIDEADSTPASYLGDYFNDLVVLNDHVDQVLTAFSKETLSDQELPFNFNVKKAYDAIIDYKNTIEKNCSCETDMGNITIFYVAYVGLMMVLYGLFLLFGFIKDIEILDFLKSPKSQDFDTAYASILQNENVDINQKKHVISLMFVFYSMTTFYRRTSGLTKFDRLSGTMYDICETFIGKFKTDEQFNLLDKELVDENFTNGISVTTFCQKYDPLSDIYAFRDGVVITNDNTNIFDFGELYLESFDFEIEDPTSTEENPEHIYLSDYCIPQIRSYLNSGMASSYTDEDISKAFTAVSNFINGVDTDQFSTVDPGIILQLVLMASSFRLLEGQDKFNEQSKNKISSAIDIIDTLIVSVYRNWFNINKYFIQPSRPNYCGTSCNQTLGELKLEVECILACYFEFVRYGSSKDGAIYDADKLLYRTFKHDVYYDFTAGNATEEDAINYLYPNTDALSFISACASRSGRTIAQCALYNNTNYGIEKLSEISAKKPLPKSVLTDYASKAESYTGVEIIDKIVENISFLKSYAVSDPEVYMIAVYTLIFDVFDKMFQKANTGNYFDFKTPEDSIGLYHMDSIISNYIALPIKNLIERNGL